MERKRIIGIDGYCYSSSFNYQLITNILKFDNIYHKYVLVMKRLVKIMRKENIQKDSSEIRIKLFEKISSRIEKFCILNFHILDISIFYDIFNRLMYDIYYRLKFI